MGREEVVRGPGAHRGSLGVLNFHPVELHGAMYLLGCKVFYHAIACHCLRVKGFLPRGWGPCQVLWAHCTNTQTLKAAWAGKRGDPASKGGK
jgi:hypothetical protein